jgi:O-antigen ligase
MSDTITLNQSTTPVAKSPISIIILIGFFSFLGLLLWLGVWQGIGIYILPAVLAIPFLILIYYYPILWIYAIPLLNILLFFDRSDGISIAESAAGFFYLITTCTWMFWKIAVQREKIITDVADFLILAFFLLIGFNSIIAVSNGVSIFEWSREVATLMYLGVFFPIRYYLRDKKQISIFLYIYSLVAIVASLIQIYQYYVGINTSAVYAYQLVFGMGIRTNQTFFTSASIFAIVFATYQKNILPRLFLFGVALITISALISTFSRTFWVILIVCIAVILLYISFKQKARLIVYSVLISVVFTSTLYLAFHDKAEILIKVLEKRISSVSKGTKDISVQARLSESKVTTRLISENWLGGNGMAKKFSFYDPITEGTLRTKMIHNGYIYMAYRLGIPLSLFYFIAFYIYTFRAEYLTRKSKVNYFKMLSLGSFASLLLLTMANFTSPQLSERDGVFVIAISFALISISHRFHKESIAN